MFTYKPLLCSLISVSHKEVVNYQLSLNNLTCLNELLAFPFKWEHTIGVAFNNTLLYLQKKSQVVWLVNWLVKSCYYLQELLQRYWNHNLIHCMCFWHSVINYMARPALVRPHENKNTWSEITCNLTCMIQHQEILNQVREAKKRKISWRRCLTSCPHKQVLAQCVSSCAPASDWWKRDAHADR